MNEVGIFNQSGREIKELEVVEEVINGALKKENLNDVSLNLIIVDNDYIRALNFNYRNIDKVTDVITFALEDEKDMILPGDFRMLGDVYISIDKAISQSLDYGHLLTRELCFLAVHGFYHLLGYDHMTKEEEEVMFKKQEEILEEYGIIR